MGISTAAWRRRAGVALLVAAAVLPLGSATAAAAPEPGTLTIAADARAVDADASIGFTLSAVGSHDRRAVLVSDLPSGTDVQWRMDRVAGDGCTLSAAGASQVLRCDLAARAKLEVHLVSGTTVSSCGTYTVRGTVRAAQLPAVTRSAVTEVRCLGIAPESVGPGSAGPVTAGSESAGAVAPQVPAGSRTARTALADTAVGPVGKELGWMVVLFVVGGLMIAVGTWTGRGRRTP